jgi:hypothetical protein
VLFPGTVRSMQSLMGVVFDFAHPLKIVSPSVRSIAIKVSRFIMYVARWAVECHAY